MDLVQSADRRRQRWSGLEEQRGTVLAYLRRRTRDSSLAEDIVQETLLRAALAPRSAPRAELLRPWLLRIASNILADRRRAGFRQPGTTSAPELLDELPDRGQEERELLRQEILRFEEHEIEAGEALQDLRASLHELRQDDQRVLQCWYAQELGTQGTALACEIAPALVKVRVCRARARLIQSLRRRIRADGRTGGVA